MGRLEGKSVIITGAGSGIGRAASLLFSKEGAKLIAVDRTEAVKDTVEQVKKAGGIAEAVMADAGSEQDVKAFIDLAVSKYGKLDAIWANAGISGGLVCLASDAPPRERLLLDMGWRFHLGNDWGTGYSLGKAETAYGPANTDYSDASWRKINLPHDWAIELPFDPTADASHGFRALGEGFPRTARAGTGAPLSSRPPHRARGFGSSSTGSTATAS